MEDMEMNERKQITIRSVKKTTYARLQEVRSASHIPLGQLVDEAVEFWFEHLPEEETAEQDLEDLC